jgi:hypothetical protein
VLILQAVKYELFLYTYAEVNDYLAHGVFWERHSVEGYNAILQRPPPGFAVEALEQQRASLTRVQQRALLEHAFIVLGLSLLFTRFWFL